MQPTIGTHVSIISDDTDQKFRVMADFSPVMIKLSTVDKLGIWFNKSWLNYTGRTLQQELDIGWIEGIHPDDYDQYLENYTNALNAQTQFSMDYRLRDKNGIYHWFSENTAPYFGLDGAFTGFISYCIDIHDRKEFEFSDLIKSKDLERSDTLLQETIDKSESRKILYETILNATTDFVYIFNFAETGHQFAYANEPLLKLFGKTYEETIGKTFLELGYEPWHAELHIKEIDLVRTSKQPLRAEVPFEGGFGKRIYDYIFSPVFDAYGEVIAVAGITRDVTDRHDTEEKLKKNEEALMQASRRKDEFLAMLAHELRNPLAPISAATKIMSHSNYDESRVRKFSQVIERQVNHMVELVNDLLDVSRVNMGLVVIDKSQQEINYIIESSIEQVKPLIEIKSHQLDFNLLSQPAYVYGDQKRLIQIFTNLLTNAAKYTKEGGKIGIDIKIDDNLIITTVSDNGIGIIQEEQDSIFELFTQAKRSVDRTQGGLGIGLALVKNMLDLHEGKIVCHSAGENKGSQFIVQLPLWLTEKETESSIENITANDGNSHSIIVVDDNIDAGTTLAELLEFSGHHVTVEHDPIQALKIIKEKLPKICILDIGLPEMDGYELARQIKKIPKMKDSILIAATGYGQENDLKMALESGFNYHFVKPVDCEKLQEILNNVHNEK
jgi:PAS domain S-box-containing protein